MSWTNRFSREGIPHNNEGSSIGRLWCCLEVSPSPGPWQPQIHYSFPFLECHVNGIMQLSFFFSWLLSLSIEYLLCAPVHNPTFHPSQRVINCIWIIASSSLTFPALSVFSLIFVINPNFVLHPFTSFLDGFLIVWEIKQDGCMFVWLSLQHVFQEGFES